VSPFGTFFRFLQNKLLGLAVISEVIKIFTVSKQKVTVIVRMGYSESNFWDYVYKEAASSKQTHWVKYIQREFDTVSATQSVPTSPSQRL
jgi:hypothetical protein